MLLRRVRGTGRDAATLPGSSDGHRAGSQSGLPGPRPMARGPSAHSSARAPTCCCARAVGGTGSRVSAALRGRGLLSFKSRCAHSEAKFCCGFSLPASPPAPAPLASAGRTRRPLPTQAQGPAGRGEGGRACAQGAGLGEAPLPGSPRRRPGPSPPRRPPHHASPEPGQAGASRAPRPTASLRGGAAPHSGPPHLSRARRLLQPLPPRSASSSCLGGFCNHSRRKCLSVPSPTLGSRAVANAAPAKTLLDPFPTQFLVLRPTIRPHSVGSGPTTW